MEKATKSGQAIVEYVLMLMVAISFVALINTSFKKSLKGIWKFYLKQVSAPCPGCEADPRINTFR
ncbi:hypothetical protein EBS43_02100 [bacterium]|jgi:hypothetical protein|nr:hypothetical protein [bacterium]